MGSLSCKTCAKCLRTAKKRASRRRRLLSLHADSIGAGVVLQEASKRRQMEEADG